MYITSIHLIGGGLMLVLAGWVGGMFYAAHLVDRYAKEAEDATRLIFDPEEER